MKRGITLFWGIGIVEDTTEKARKKFEGSGDY